MLTDSATRALEEKALHRSVLTYRRSERDDAFSRGPVSKSARPSGGFVRRREGADPSPGSHPTTAAAAALVERWFAALTEKQIRRGAFRSTRELETVIKRYLQINNHNPKPFIWTKTNFWNRTLGIHQWNTREERNSTNVIIVGAGSAGAIADCRLLCIAFAQ